VNIVSRAYTTLDRLWLGLRQTLSKKTESATLIYATDINEVKDKLAAWVRSYDPNQSLIVIENYNQLAALQHQC
jgi:flagellar capping protein FliD